MKLSKTMLVPLLLGFLSSCGETTVDSPQSGGGLSTPAGQRELLLALQNRLVVKPSSSRAGEIASTAEKRIDALDVYVFGSRELDGNYTFQEKFSYRSDGSVVDNTTAIELEGGDGTTNHPTVLLRPKKGLYIKLYCIANQTELYRLDEGDPAHPVYVPYTDFTPLVQTSPGDAAHNTVTEGIPTETEFCQLVGHVINPAMTDDNLLPPLPMSGANTAPIDLHDFSLASRLYANIKLKRTVARFDIVNKSDDSRFTIEGIGMGNGRPVSMLFPAEALKTPDDELSDYPVRDVTALAGLNGGTATTAFYSYGSPADDKGYLILKGKYHMNLTEQKDVSYNVSFSQVKDGTGSHIEINPNHRYTVSITKADPQQVYIDITVADWDEGDDLGEYDPENGMTDFSVEPAAQYDAATSTANIPVSPGSTLTVTTSSNAPVSAELFYTSPGNEWLEATVTNQPATRTIWTQKATCELKVKEGSFSSYPKVTLRLTDTASGDYRDILVEALGVYLGEVKPAVATYNSYDEPSKTLTMYAAEGAQATATVYCPHGLKPVESLPSWLKANPVENGGTTVYTFTLDKGGFPADLSTQDATHTVTFTDKTDNTMTSDLNFVLKSSAIDKTGTTLTAASGTSGNSYTSTLGSETVRMTCTDMTTTSFDLTIPSAKGVTLSGNNDFGWFTVTHTQQWTESAPKDVFRFNSRSGQSAYTDKELTFSNNIAGGEGFSLKVLSDVFLSTVSLTGTASAYNSYASASRTLTLHAVGSNAAMVKVFSNDDLDVTNVPVWLSVSPSTSSTGYRTYMLALKNLTSASYGNVLLTFTNRSDATRKTTLNVTLKSPSITTTGISTGGATTGNSYVAGTTPTVANSFASTATMTANVSTISPFTLTIPSPCGTTINSTNFTWFTVTQSKAWSKNDPTDVYRFQVQLGVVYNNIGTATVAFSSKVPGGGTHTVKVSKNTSTIYSPAVSGFEVVAVGSYYMSVGYQSSVGTWSEANRLCSSGGNGWRLPTIQEFGSLAGYSGGYTDGYPNAASFTVTQNRDFFSTTGKFGGYYMWTQSKDKSGSSYYAFYVDSSYKAHFSAPANPYVRCIRNK